MFPEARNLRNECWVHINCIERQAEINNYTASRRLDLHTGATNLLGAAMDAGPHAILHLGENQVYSSTKYKEALYCSDTGGA